MLLPHTINNIRDTDNFLCFYSRKEKVNGFRNIRKVISEIYDCLTVASDVSRTMTSVLLHKATMA